MKVNPKFRLRKPNDETTSIYLDVRYKGQRVVYGTELVIAPALWDKDTMRASTKTKVIGNYKKDPSVRLDCDRINSHLNKIYDAVIDYFVKAGEQVGTPEEVKTYIISQVAPERVRSATTNLNGYIDHFIDEMVSGRLQTIKGTKYAATTVKQYKSFRLRFNEFQTKKRKVYDFDDIDMDFYDRFSAYLTEINNQPNSVGKQIKCMKAILRSAIDKKLHTNRTFQNKKFTVQRLETNSIYLTETELARIAALDLTGKKHLEIARDLFLIGCYTAQRISDYSKINKDSISNRSGFQAIELIQAKTGQRVIVPIKPELLKILKKYDFTAPYMVEQKLNQYIKKIGQMAGIDEGVPITEYSQGRKIVKHVPKFTLIQSHTARRTGATLMYLAGILLPDVMKITGHKNVKQLMQYIRVTEEETASKLALHPYFSTLKVEKG